MEIYKWEKGIKLKFSNSVVFSENLKTMMFNSCFADCIKSLALSKEGPCSNWSSWTVSSF